MGSHQHRHSVAFLIYSRTSPTRMYCICTVQVRTIKTIAIDFNDALRSAFAGKEIIRNLPAKQDFTSTSMSSLGFNSQLPSASTSYPRSFGSPAPAGPSQYTHFQHGTTSQSCQPPAMSSAIDPQLNMMTPTRQSQSECATCTSFCRQLILHHIMGHSTISVRADSFIPSTSACSATTAITRGRLILIWWPTRLPRHG